MDDYYGDEYDEEDEAMEEFGTPDVRIKYMTINEDDCEYY